jgi:hypothetical protein
MRDIVDVDQVYSNEIKANVDAMVIPEVRSSLRFQLSIAWVCPIGLMKYVPRKYH